VTGRAATGALLRQLGQKYDFTQQAAQFLAPVLIQRQQGRLGDTQAEEARAEGDHLGLQQDQQGERGQRLGREQFVGARRGGARHAATRELELGAGTTVRSV